MSSLPRRDAGAALSEAFAETQAQIARTDTKASHLTTFLSVVLAGAGVVGSAVPLPLVARIVGGVGVVALMAAAEVLLSVIRPRLSPVARGSLVHWSTLTPEALREAMSTDHHCEAVVVLAELAVAKYRRLQRAVDLTRAGGALLVVAGLIAVGGAS